MGARIWVHNRQRITVGIEYKNGNRNLKHNIKMLYKIIIVLLILTQ